MSNAASFYPQNSLQVPNVEETYSWHEQFYYFALFRTLNGPNAAPGKDCDTPINDDTHYTQAYLCGWIREQNAARKAFLDGRASALTADQIRVLDGVAFPWTRDSSERWDGHYRELLEYREEHGHCNVPRSAGALGVWVKNQRAAYFRLREVTDGRAGDGGAKKTTAVITPDQVRLLEDIGFQWKVRIEHAVAWNAHYEKLRAFKEERGHCRVSAKDDAGLSRWIFEMRSRRKKQASGERPRIQIKEEQIAKLNDIGFEWKGWGGDPEEKRQRAEEAKVRRNEARKRKRAEVRLQKQKEAEERRKEEEEAAAAAREEEGGGAEEQTMEADTEKRRKADEAKARRNERRRRKRAEIRLQKQKEAEERRKEEKSTDGTREEEEGGAEEQMMEADADPDEKSPPKKRRKTGGAKPKSAGQTTDVLKKPGATMQKTKAGADRVKKSVDGVKNDIEERLAAEKILVESGVTELEEEEGIVHC